MKKRFIYFGSSVLVCTMILVFLSVSDGCSKSSSSNNPPAPIIKDVVINNTAFVQSSVTIAVNTTVKWTNNDPFDHTVTSDTGLFDSGNFGTGGTYSHKFTTTGTFPYHCTVHSMMTGTVIVQ